MTSTSLVRRTISKFGAGLPALAILFASSGVSLMFDGRAQAVTSITPCSATKSIHSVSLSAWDLSQTRATGHNNLTSEGLRIYTEGSTSTDKAAGYYSTNFSLSKFGTKTIEESLVYEANFGIKPGLQLIVDFDNNGTLDGILVGESIYGSHWWLSNSASDFVKNNAPNTSGGYGSPWHGTPQQWLDSFPNAYVKAIGYSLGSGVHGDGIIKMISLGCTNYTFGLDQTLPQAKIKAAPESIGYDNVFSKVSFKLSDNDKVKGYSINGIVTNVTPSKYSDANGISIGKRGATYGKNSFVVEDVSGNKSEPVVFYLDDRAPTITVKDTSIGSDNLFSKVDFKLYDEFKVSKYYVNGSMRSVTPNKWSDANGIAVGKNGGQEGVNTIIAEDLLGNKSEPVVFYLDSIKPTLSVKPESIGSNGVYKTVSFKLFDANKVRSITVNNNPEKLLTPNKWSDANGITAGKNGGVEGENKIILKDLAGNTTEFSFVIDTTAPVVTIDPLTTSDNTPILTGSVSDSSAMVRVMVAGKNYEAQVTGQNWTVEIPDPLLINTYDVVVTAVDRVTNTGSDATTDELVITPSLPGISPTTPPTPLNENEVSPLAPAGAQQARGVGSSPTAASTPQVLGASTTAPNTVAAETGSNDVKGVTTTQDDDKKVENSAFLGLGWWWLPIAVVLVAFFGLFAARRRVEQ